MLKVQASHNSCKTVKVSLRLRHREHLLQAREPEEHQLDRHLTLLSLLRVSISVTPDHLREQGFPWALSERVRLH